MSDRIKRVELEDQLETLNGLLGTSFVLSHGPNGYALVTGRQEKRRPAKEMYWTLDFAIDMVERLHRDMDMERLDRFAEYVALAERGFEEPGRALLRDDWRFVEPKIVELDADAEGGDA